MLSLPVPTKTPVPTKNLFRNRFSVVSGNTYATYTYASGTGYGANGGDGEKLSVHDAAGASHLTQYGYDGFNRPNETIFPDGSTEQNRISNSSNEAKMKKTPVVVATCLLVLFASGCTGSPRSDYVVKDTATAIRIGLDACISKKVVQPSPSDMRAELRNGSWHVWEQGEKCEVFSTDVDAFIGIAGDCSVCVT